MDLQQKDWEQRYIDSNTPWDIGAVSTPLKAYIDQLQDKDLSILIPGAGNGHEAIYAWKNGFNHVYLCDWSPTAIERFVTDHPDFPKDQTLCKDFFDLDQKFDLIIEQTFFCAIPRRLRDDYARQCFKLLRPNGMVAGVLFASEFEAPGPPFGGSAAEYRGYFEDLFEISTLEPCYNSIEPRSGNELFLIVQRSG